MPSRSDEPDTTRNTTTPTRGERRKQRTRRRLLDAAFELMADRGPEAVAINEITDLADVGFGSFYNHFASKEAIFDAVMDEVFEGYADALDELIADVEDPAEVIALSMRITLLRAHHEPKWGRFLMREGLSPRTLSRGLGMRLMRDIGRGIATGRFDGADHYMSFIAVGGIVLAAVAAEEYTGREDSPQSELVRDLGMEVGNIGSRATTMALKVLGIPPGEARDIASRPLPPMVEERYVA